MPRLHRKTIGKGEIYMTLYEHKGYTLTQADYNNHYMIFDSDGHMVMHVPYDKPITKEKTVEFIEHYITLNEQLENVIDDLQD